MGVARAIRGFGGLLSTGRPGIIRPLDLPDQVESVPLWCKSMELASGVRKRGFSLFSPITVGYSRSSTRFAPTASVRVCFTCFPGLGTGRTQTGRRFASEANGQNFTVEGWYPGQQVRLSDSPVIHPQ